MNPSVTGRYVSDSVTTASPGQLLVMLYDRLALDLDRAEAALRSHQPAHEYLLHAQDIIVELRCGLRPEVWSGGDALASLYTFLLTELIAANVKRDPQRVHACKQLVEPLRDAWREAAVIAMSSLPVQPYGGSAGSPTGGSYNRDAFSQQAAVPSPLPRTLTA